MVIEFVSIYYIFERKVDIMNNSVERKHLDNDNFYYLTITKDENGKIVNYSFDIESAHDKHFVFSVKDMEKTVTVLQSKLGVADNKDIVYLFKEFLNVFEDCELVSLVVNNCTTYFVY